MWKIVAELPPEKNFVRINVAPVEVINADGRTDVDSST